MDPTKTKPHTLTRGEEEVMQALWQIGSGCINDLIARMRKPAPKYTTVATFIKILKDKGFVAHEVSGKSHRYYPLVEREAYARNVARSVLNSYFDGSLARMVTCFSGQEDVSVQEMEQIIELLGRIKGQQP